MHAIFMIIEYNDILIKKQQNSYLNLEFLMAHSPMFKYCSYKVNEGFSSFIA